METEGGNVYERARMFYEQKKTKELESLFSKHLKMTYTLPLWNLYIEYVKKVSVKKVNLTDVYSFVLLHFEHSYERTSLVREYIAELQNLEDDALKVERIRKVYHKAFTTPMHEISQLKAEYEKWEMEVNRQAARTFIEQIQPTYSNTLIVYNRLRPHLNSGSFFQVFDIELGNPLRIPTKSFNSRLAFIFRYFESKYPDDEAVLFLHSFYLGEQALYWNATPENKNNCFSEDESLKFTPFLSIWYSFLSKKNMFRFDDPYNSKLILINYFSWLIKFKGIDAFRSKFNELKTEDVNEGETRLLSPYAYVYAAEKEYSVGSSKENAYRILTEALEKYPDNSLVTEIFFELFLRNENTEHVIPHLKQLKKTAKVWKEMARYICKHETIEEFKEFMQQWCDAESKGEILPPVPVENSKHQALGTQGLYENTLASFSFYDLTLGESTMLESFIARLPVISEEENILKGVDPECIIELLSRI